LHSAKIYNAIVVAPLSFVTGDWTVYLISSFVRYRTKQTDKDQRPAAVVSLCTQYKYLLNFNTRNIPLMHKGVPQYLGIAPT